MSKDVAQCLTVCLLDEAKLRPARFAFALNRLGLSRKSPGSTWLNRLLVHTEQFLV